MSAAVIGNKKTDYVGNKIYEDDQLKRILVDGGYYDVSASKYYFYLTDHLGNNRAVFTHDCVLAERTQYYPFGSAFAEGLGDGVQPYKYNGKEPDKMHGLNMYDYSARHYDAAIGRFTTIDPKAESFYYWSPYVYVMNNPINAVDLRGDSIWYTIDNDIDIVTLHYTGKMINMSSDNINLGAAIKDIGSAITKAFKDASISIDGKEYSLNVNVQITAASSMKDVTDSDHLFVMADGPGGKYGITNEIGGKVVHLNASYYHNEGILSSIFGVANNSRSGAHEFGHTLGLEHPDRGGIGYNSATDIMVQGGNGGKFSGGDVQRAYNNWKSVSLNKGSNYTVTNGQKLPYQGVQYRGNVGTISTLGFSYK